MLNPLIYWPLSLAPLTFVGPQANAGDAAYVIANYTSDCYAYGYISDAGTPTVGLIMTADLSTANTIVLTGDTGAVVDYKENFMFVSVNVKASSTVSVAFDFTLSGGDYPLDADVFIYECGTGVLIGYDYQSPPSSPTGTLNVSLTNAGEYIVFLRAVYSGGNPWSVKWTITASNNPFTANPIAVAWNDSGTIRHIWACPKLLLPPLTEASGSLYVDCATAHALIAARVSNCVGYFEGPEAFESGFTATDGGTSLTLAKTWSHITAWVSKAWGGINAEKSKTLTFTFTTSAGAWEGEAIIYDDTGSVVQTLTPATSPMVSSALPYKGRYTVSFRIPNNAPYSTYFNSANVVITSYGVLSVNPVQALYEGDPSTNCASRLNCGDACP